jgi:hypothetical protein
VQHGHDAIESVLDVHDDVRLEAAGLGKGVREEEHDRTEREVGHIRTDGGHGEQVRCILDQQAGESVIRMVVRRAVSDDEVRVKRSDEAYHLVAKPQAVVELAVGLIEDLVSCTDDGRGRLSFGSSTAGELRPIHRLVTGLAVGQTHQSYDMTQSTPLSAIPPTLMSASSGCAPMTSIRKG